MSKYGESLGIMTLNMNEMEFELRPKKGDNLNLMKIMNKTKNNPDIYMQEMIKFIINLIKREPLYKPDTPAEEEELETAVEFNVMDLMKQIMIAFRFTTKEKLEATEKEALKKNLI